MKITGTETELIILKELGTRMKQHRLTLNVTQQEFAKMCGISESTLVRMEMGADSKMSNLIKILFALNMSENLNVLLPEIQPDYKALFEEKAMRQRAKSKNSKQSSNWTWEEDK